MSACIETSWAAVTAIFGSTNEYQEASRNEHEVHDQHPCLEYSVITRNERGSLTQSRCGISARIWRVGVRVIGGYFVGTAVLNMVYTARHARDFLGWLAEHSRFPPYRGVFRAFEPIAPAIMLGAAAFQATLAYHLLRGRRVSVTLRWAEAWVLGLSPALTGPYWTVNAGSAVAFEAVRRGALNSVAPAE